MGKADFDELIKETQENGKFKEVIQYFPLLNNRGYMADQKY